MKLWGRASEARRQRPDGAALGGTGFPLQRRVEDPLDAGDVEQFEDLWGRACGVALVRTLSVQGSRETMAIIPWHKNDQRKKKLTYAVGGARAWRAPGILVHELILAVGLSNDKHSGDDVFAAKSVVIPKGTYLKSKAKASEDLVQSPDGSDPMPPIRIGGKTITTIKHAWIGDEAS